MPNLNEPVGFEELPATPKPRNPQRKRGGMSPVVIIVAVILLVGGGAFLLNLVGVIHLWGEKTPPKASQALPPPVPVEEPAVVDTQIVEPPEITKPLPKEKPLPLLVSVTGPYVYQVSSWKTMSKADKEAKDLKSAGLNAYVDEITMDGSTSYRVRVGYFSTASEAKRAAEELGLNWESGYHVVKVKQ